MSSRFHARSYATFQKSGMTADEFKSQFSYLGTDDLVEHASLRPIYSNPLAAEKMIDATKQHACAEGILTNDQAADLIPRLETFIKQDLPGMAKEALVVDSEMNCFVHGDCWLNNILIK